MTPDQAIGGSEAGPTRGQSESIATWFEQREVRLLNTSGRLPAHETPACTLRRRV